MGLCAYHVWLQALGIVVQGEQNQCTKFIPSFFVCLFVIPGNVKDLLLALFSGITLASSGYHMGCRDGILVGCLQVKCPTHCVFAQ